MLKIVSILIPAVLFLTAAQIAFTQKSKSDAPREKTKTVVSDSSESEFYKSSLLRSDFKEVDVVAYVDVKERKLEDFIGGGDCETDKGAGYCLYRLKAEVKEVFKGQIGEKTVEFYMSPDMDYPKKYLMGERVVFLKWNASDANKNKSLGAIENSTRSIKYDVLEKMRKIARGN
jgi:hypothetical protein